MAYHPTYRRKSGQKGSSVSMFPFLAVLLCTMGALIMILILIARQTMMQRAAVTEKECGMRNAECGIDENNSEFRTPNSELIKSLPPMLSEEDIHEKQAFLQQEKRRLSQAISAQQAADRGMMASEETLSAVRTDIQNAAANAHRLAGVLEQAKNTDDKVSPRDLKMRIAERELEIEKLEEKIRAAESNAKEKDGSYVVVPYDGPGGTRRYPLYVECRADGAYLMPEEIRIRQDDFEGILSKSNPLQAALSAKRDYLRDSRAFFESPEGAQEPYPLLIVRPEGILYLYMAREAIRVWWKEFGFELVGEKIKIEYPPTDETARRQMLAAVQSAREFQKELAISSPAISHLAEGGLSGAGSVIAFRQTPEGPMPMNVDNDSRIARTLRNSSGRPTAIWHEDVAFPSSGGVASQQSGKFPSSGGVAAQQPGWFGADGTGQGGSPVLSSGSLLPDAAGNFAGGGGNDSGISLTETGNAGESPTVFVFSHPPQTGGQHHQERVNPAEVGLTAIAYESGNQLAAMSGASGNPGDLPEWANPEKPFSGAFDDEALRQNAAREARPADKPKNSDNPWPGFFGEMAVETTARATDQANAAAAGEDWDWKQYEQRRQDERQQAGENQKKSELQVSWTPDNYHPSLSPLSRPIRVECHGDTLIIPATRDSREVRIPYTSPYAATQQLVKEVGEQVRSWGTPGPGMYWRPRLRVEVAADGRGRFLEMNRMLDGSGLEIEEVNR